MQAPIVGIDIGTTTSALASSRLFPEGVVSVPTVVTFGKEHAVVGQPALDRAIRRPRRTVTSFPRLLGTNARVSIVVGGQTWEYTPEELVALVLTKLQRVAFAEGGRRFGRAVLTVPATFTARQRVALCTGCSIAGVSVERLVAAPVAGALAHGLRTGVEGTILVYDLGGGWFDAALIDITDGVFEVVGTHGDPWVGGDAFDGTIVEWLDLHCKQKYGFCFDSDPVVTERLFASARAAKHALASHTSTTISIDFEHEGQRYDIRQPLHRDQLERRTRDLVGRTVAVCEELLAGSRYSEGQLDGIFFVGGGTELPFVRERVTERFGHTGRRLPSEWVALGATARGAIVHDASLPDIGATNETVVLDATPHSIRLGPTRLIPNNAPVPTRATAVCTTTTDRQQHIVVPVYYDRGLDRSTDVDGMTTNEQTEEPRATSPLWDAFRVGPVLPRPAGVPSIELTVAFDPNGMVRVDAKDLEHERDGAIETASIYRRTPTEIKTMKQQRPSVR